MFDTLTPSKERVREILNSKGISLSQVMAEPAVFNKACKYIYKSIPIPWRWFIGKRRIERLLTRLTERLSGSSSQRELAAKKRATNG